MRRREPGSPYRGSPSFCLPKVTTGHIRTFQSSNLKDASAKQKIFDAFVATEKNARVLISFAHEAQSSAAEDLDNLLWELNFLGRSESWVKTCLTDIPDDTEWNCRPVGNGSDPGHDTRVQVACLIPREDYAELELPEPCAWPEAACLSTRDLLQKGWSRPPAIQWHTYGIKAGIINHIKPKQRQTGYQPAVAVHKICPVFARIAACERNRGFCRLSSVWQSGSKPDVRLVLTEMAETAETAQSDAWVSATPFVTARHYRSGRGTYEQWLTREIMQECEFHSLPKPTSVDWIPTW